MGEDFAEEENEGVDDDDAVAFDLSEDIAEAVGGNGVKDAGTVQRRDGDEIEKHEAEVDIDELGEDKGW